MNSKPRWLWIPGWCFFLIFLALDFVTKSLVSAHIPPPRVHAIIPGLLNLTLVHNSGAVFGIGHHWSVPFFLVTSVVAMGVIFYLFMKLEEADWMSRWGLLLILSGALGNFIDRVRVGYVVDFIDVYFRSYHWWTFNVADSYITVGAVFFGLDMLLKRKQDAPAE